VSENNGPKSGSAAKGVAREQVENVPSEGLLKVEEAVKRFHDNRSGDSHAREPSTPCSVRPPDRSSLARSPRAKNDTW
jgi:hypothetical protein